jgi:divalent metal cation (Fe/Co/Zn/Cd) transporter
MEMKQRSKRLYWLLFFISTAALLLAIALHWPWLTMIIPFVVTFFVLAMGII